MREIVMTTPMPCGQTQLEMKMSLSQGIRIQRLWSPTSVTSLISNGRAAFCHTLSVSEALPSSKNSETQLPKLPKARFPGKCILITDPATEEVKYKKEILSLISNSKILGFDTESLPPFYTKDGRNRPPCLVQLANEELCVMWRLRKQRKLSSYCGVNFPPMLHSILTSKDIMKVGHSSRCDAMLLLLHYNINMCKILDTHDTVISLNLEQKSLRGLTGALLGLRLDKSQGMSNWEKEKLTENQIAYACTDAWVSLGTYNSLVRHAEKKGLELLPPFEDALGTVTKEAEKKRLGLLVANALSKRSKRAVQAGEQDHIRSKTNISTNSQVKKFVGGEIKPSKKKVSIVSDSSKSKKSKSNDVQVHIPVTKNIASTLPIVKEFQESEEIESSVIAVT